MADTATYKIQQVLKSIVSWSYEDLDKFSDSSFRLNSEYDMLQIRAHGLMFRIELYTWNKYAFESCELEEHETAGQLVFKGIFNAVAAIKRLEADYKNAE